MKLFCILVLQCAVVYNNEEEIARNDFDGAFSNIEVANKQEMNFSASNELIDDTEIFKGLIFSSETDEMQNNKENFTSDEKTVKYDEMKSKFLNQFIPNELEDTDINSIPPSSNGTDILHILESLFEKASFPSEQDIPMLNRKVFRGARVTIREHPYIVSIRRENSHYLMGTLLTQKVVLTVAHPIYHVPLSDLRVVVGENYNDRGTTLLTLILVIMHNTFNPNTLRGDLALLVIYEDLNYKITVKPIPIFPPTQSLQGKTAFVTGWGRCDRSGKELCLPRSNRFFRNEIMDPMLRTVKFKINDTSCSKDYKDKNLDFGIICPGDYRSEDLLCPCMAVPGAPLVVDAALAGVQSWGFGCGYVDDRPLVYTSTAAYQPWLIHNILILGKLTKEQSLPLFEATKATFLMHWLQETRINIPNVQLPQINELNVLDVDLELGKLRGRVYDIRDYMDGRRYHQTKKLLFMRIKKQFADKLRMSNLNIAEILRVHPFMDVNVLRGTGLSISNGTLVQNEETLEETSLVGTNGQTDDDVTSDTTISDLGMEDTAY